MSLQDSGHRGDMFPHFFVDTALIEQRALPNSPLSDALRCLSRSEWTLSPCQACSFLFSNNVTFPTLFFGSSPIAV